MTYEAIDIIDTKGWFSFQQFFYGKEKCLLPIYLVQKLMDINME